MPTPCTCGTPSTPHSTQSHNHPGPEPADVLFRVTKGDERKEVVAVLSVPNTVTFGLRSGNATCYAHAGQHGECHVSWYIERTRAATPEEYAALKRELESIGYVLNIKTRRKVR